MKVYVLQHVHDRGAGDEDVKAIGVYSSKQAGEAAIARLVQLPGFSDTPNGFSLEAHELDETQWASGYVTPEGPDTAS